MKNLALFDFDGTITRSDSTLYFFKSLYKSKFLFIYKHYVTVIGYLIGYKLKFISVTRLKEVRLNSHLNKFNNSELNKLIQIFNKNYFNNEIKISGLSAIKNHLEKGDTVCIVSASWFPLLNLWVAENGIHLITNCTTRDQKGNFCFIKRDCNYEEKAKRIKETFDVNLFDTIYAYGDTEGDREMLKIADKPYFCFFND